MGVKVDLLQVENWESGEFFVGATVRHKVLNFRWDILTVYGPANHERSPCFLQELTMRCQNATLPIVMGDNFNLIRSLQDKSTGVGDENLIQAFNNFIEGQSLREMYRSGGEIYLDKQAGLSHTKQY